MGFHLLWGLVLWFSISKLGLWLSTDSVHLLFAGLNFSEGHGLISFTGSPVLGWPPLYPLLLAAVHVLTGMDIFAAAHVLQALAFLGLSFCLSILFLRIFPGNFALAFAANLLSDIGVVIVLSFDLVGSDYVELFLVILAVLLTAESVHSGSPRTFVALSIVGMLAMLQRYLGIAAIGTAALSVLLLPKGKLSQRLLRSAVLGLSALPAGAWLLVASPFVSRRGPVPFIDNFRWFSQSIIQWFLPGVGLQENLWLYIVLLWLLVIGLVVLVYRSRQNVLNSFAAPLLLFGLVYMLALFSSASIAYFNTLAGRFLLPMYVPFVGLLLLATQAVLDIAARHESPALRRAVTLGATGFLSIMGLLALGASAPVILQSHAGLPVDENAFNTMEWRSNSALLFWEDHKPAGDFLLFSNEPDGVAFYALHSCYPSPQQYSGPYGKVEFPVESYGDELFSSGQDVYLVWITSSQRNYYYQPEDLATIADVTTLFSGTDGAVYRLSPKVDG